MGRKVHYFHAVTKAQRAATRAQATASRHGPSVVYVDGAPVVLNALAQEMGCTLEQLSRRVYAARKAGTPLTLGLLRRPFSRV